MILFSRLAALLILRVGRRLVVFRVLLLTVPLTAGILAFTVSVLVLTVLLLITAVALGVPGILLVVILIAVLVLLFLIQKFLDNSPVVKGVFHVGRCVQRRIIGSQGLFQFSGTGQGIAPVVTGTGTLFARKRFGGAVELAGTIEGGAPPFRVFKLAGG